MLINVGRGAPRLTGNATPADVVAGKTFYSGDARTKQTGSMSTQAMTKYATGTVYGGNSSGTEQWNERINTGFYPRAIRVDATGGDWGSFYGAMIDTMSAYDGSGSWARVTSRDNKGFNITVSKYKKDGTLSWSAWG